MNTIKAFLSYQSVRFPLRILIFTTAATVLCSAAVLNYQVRAGQVLMAFFAAMFFLFHIRLLDEVRDFADDSVRTPDSPVHSGIISLKQLFYIDFAGLIIFTGISILNGLASVILAISLFLFTSLAWKDFFIRKYIIKRKVIYHLINSPQMILLQLFIFTIFTHSLHFTHIIWLATVFVYVNIFVLELIRKIRVDKEAQIDTYNAYLGFNRSVIITYIFAIISFLLYFFIINSISGSLILFFLLSSPIWILLTIAFIFYLVRKNTKWQSLFLLSVLVKYIGLNVLICLSVL